MYKVGVCIWISAGLKRYRKAEKLEIYIDIPPGGVY